MKRIVFIVNPKSGVFSKESIHEAIKSSIDTQSYTFDIEFTERPGHAIEISRHHAGSGADIIVAVGGDGSVNEVARSLVGTDVALGIIPGGSGNGLAHFLKIPLNQKKAIELINTGRVVKIDTGSINGHFFVSIAGIGYDGLVARRFSKEKFRGFVAYLKAVAETYPGYKPKKYTLFLNGETIRTRALFIAFANSDQFGFQTAIAPDAIIDDGLLDVIVMQKPPLIDIPLLAGLLYWRKVDKSKFIQVYKAAGLIVETRKNRWVNIDGEPRKLGKKLEVNVHPRSLNVIIP
jgi:diacylglycerol kinase (ATP)